MSIIKALCLLLLFAVAALAQDSNVVVSYSFDDDNIATGPDTFTVFNFAKGNVGLTTTYSHSGYRSVEIRDQAGDKDFPELQGYFPVRTKGHLFAHFSFMTTSPDEPLNIALAGPRGFAVRKDGIAFWLSTEQGVLFDHSDKSIRKLISLEPFEWYTVDVDYNIDQGLYDLFISGEDKKKLPLVSLLNQKNCASLPASAVDKFSFIGDLGDKSNVTYYVDDVVVRVDEKLQLNRFVAPGRRKLFIDRWDDSLKQLLKNPHMIPAIDVSDFGIDSVILQSLKREGMVPALEALMSDKPFDPQLIKNASPNNLRLLYAMSLWRSGNEELRRHPETAFENFEEAAMQVPEGKIYALSSVLALVALKRWNDVDGRMVLLFAQWHQDPRFAIVSAMIEIAKGNLPAAENALRDPAELISKEPDDAILRRLWSGLVNEALVNELEECLSNQLASVR
jgi:hypothetical protein